jgi:heme exporter protein B
MIEIISAILKSQIRSKSIAFRTFPFVSLILLLFAFAFDPDSGVISSISPGLFWLSVLFGSTFIFTTQSQNRSESKFFSSYGIEPMAIFFSRAIVNAIFIFILSVFSGFLTIALYSPPIKNILVLLLVVLVTTIALSTVGAIYTPLLEKTRDGGQLLSLLVIPILIPVFIGAIKATQILFDLGIGNAWPWIGLSTIFSFLYLSAGALASSSIYD